jgi:hypothetical protein
LFKFLELHLRLLLERRYLAVALPKLDTMAINKPLCLIHRRIIISAVQWNRFEKMAVGADDVNAIFRHWTHLGLHRANSIVDRAIRSQKMTPVCPVSDKAGQLCKSTFYAVGVPPLRSWETAVTSWAGANGLVRRTLWGTPCEAHWSALAAVM